MDTKTTMLLILLFLSVPLLSNLLSFVAQCTQLIIRSKLSNIFSLSPFQKMFLLRIILCLLMGKCYTNCSYKRLKVKSRLNSRFQLLNELFVSLFFYFFPLKPIQNSKLKFLQIFYCTIKSDFSKFYHR